MHQLKELGVDQAALVGEPDHLVYGLGLEHDFHHVCQKSESFGSRRTSLLKMSASHGSWIKNDKLPSRLELRDNFHAFESEENRSEMIGWAVNMLQLLHIIDILTPQV